MDSSAGLGAQQVTVLGNEHLQGIPMVLIATMLAPCNSTSFDHSCCRSRQSVADKTLKGTRGYRLR